MIAPPTCARPDPAPRKPAHSIPKNACDCHFHIFDAPSQQIAARSYTAPGALAPEYRNLQQALGLERAVIVQPSIYGTDNRTTLQSIPDDGSMKAVVVLDPDCDDKAISMMAAKGAVGHRANLLFPGGPDPRDLQRLCRRLADFGWHLQILADLSEYQDLTTLTAQCPVPVVVDHMGHIPTRKGINDPGFQTLLRQLDRGSTWVKLSAAYRMCSTPFDDIAPFAQALIKANPDRLVWGSDWPVVDLGGGLPEWLKVTDALLSALSEDEADAIGRGNAIRVYGLS